MRSHIRSTDETRCRFEGKEFMVFTVDQRRRVDTGTRTSLADNLAAGYGASRGFTTRRRHRQTQDL